LDLLEGLVDGCFGNLLDGKGLLFSDVFPVKLDLTVESFEGQRLVGAVVPDAAGFPGEIKEMERIEVIV
jgi:hypothetical protein